MFFSSFTGYSKDYSFKEKSIFYKDLYFRSLRDYSNKNEKMLLTEDKNEETFAVSKV